MIRLHNNLEVALWDAGRKISIYGSLSADREDSENRSEAVAIAYTLIKAQIEEQLGREYLEDAPLDGGSDGLQFLESTMDGDIYEINMTYRVRPPFSFRDGEDSGWQTGTMGTDGAATASRERKRRETMCMLRRTRKYIIPMKRVLISACLWSRWRAAGYRRSTDPARNVWMAWMVYPGYRGIAFILFLRVVTAIIAIATARG